MAKFLSGRSYSRRDVLDIVGLDDPGGGAWYTGLVTHQSEHFIFCGVGITGRTGHDYHNFFDGEELVWHGRTGSRSSHRSIKRITGGDEAVHIFFRDDNRSAFTYAGIAKAVSIKDVTPVEVRWSFPHPEYLPNELPPNESFTEGAKRTITVNAYERNPAARARCIAYWGTSCIVCGFDFAQVYGELGQGYIHVHHLRPLAEIGEEYELDAINDLRPVCPNCHAMLHRKRPAFGIDELKGRINE